MLNLTCKSLAGITVLLLMYINTLSVEVLQLYVKFTYYVQYYAKEQEMCSVYYTVVYEVAYK